MLTDKQRAEGWIEHDGGPCPVPLDSKVILLHRGWTTPAVASASPARWSEEWGRWNWKGSPFEGWRENIIAYRPENPNG